MSAERRGEEATRAERAARWLDGARALVERSPVYWAATALLAGLLALPVVLRYPINHDAGALLELAQRVLSGERLYTQISEPNPPLIIYLHMLVVLAARVVGVTAWKLLYACLVGLVAGCALVAYRVLDAFAIPESLADRRVLLWIALYASFVVPGYDFGQRDPLMACLTLPYVAAAAGAARGERLRPRLAALVGVLAAVGFALKPFLVPLWLLTEGYLVLVRKQRRAFLRLENLLVMGLVGAYGLWVLLGTGYVANLGVFVTAYHGYEATAGDVFATSQPYLWAAAIALLLVARHPRERRDLHALLGVAVLAFLYSGLVQGKNWNYHFAGEVEMAWLAIGAAALGLAALPEAPRVLRFPARAVPAAIAAGLLLFAADGVRLLVVYPEWPIGPAVRQLADAVRRLDPADGGIAWVTTSCPPAFPATTYAGNHGVLTLGVWPIPVLYGHVRPVNGHVPYTPPDRMTPFERQVYDRMAADLERTRPALVAFDHRPYRQGLEGSPFVFEEYFARDPRIRRLLATEYAPAEDVAGFRFYRRIKARPAPSGGSSAPRGGPASPAPGSPRPAAG